MACDLLIVGADGDLAFRKLFPAVYSLCVGGHLPDDFRVIALSKSNYVEPEFLYSVRDAISAQRKASPLTDENWHAFAGSLCLFCADATSSEGLAGLQEAYLEDSTRELVIYLATPPSIFSPVCCALNKAGLVRKNTRIVVEKPLGEDRETYLDIDRQLTQVFEESQIYRIDHYLGKEPVQNLLALRFANMFLEPLWNQNYIDSVQISVAESLGVSGRWQFYDAAGAMRDMVQNHLLQLLCLLAMEPPAQLEGSAVRNEKLKVLSCLRSFDKHDLEAGVVTGQYGSGVINGATVPGYLDEGGASSQSSTETFVALRVFIDNWRWAGVPFYLRTGKRLHSRFSEIVVDFKRVPHSIFDGVPGSNKSNRLIIRLQPDETVRLEMMNRVAGLGASRPLQTVSLDLSSPQDSRVSIPDAYQRLLLDVIQQNPTLFVSSDEIEQAWKWVDKIQHAWRLDGKEPERYMAGSWGPSGAIALMARDGRCWHDGY